MDDLAKIRLIEDLENADPFEHAYHASMLCEQAAAALRAYAEREKEIMDALKAVSRAAELALFVIRKQGVMPNSSWEAGFNKDTAPARVILDKLKQS
jgi:hypothetical protein